jgi:hypothetical protein
MARKWNILTIGTRVRIKRDKEHIDGKITNWLTDDKKVIVGYLVVSDNDPSTLIALALDDEFKVLGV